MNPRSSFSIFGLILMLLKNAASGQILSPSCLNSTYDPRLDNSYATNLDSVLSSLSSKASAGNIDDYFYNNSTAGVGGSDAVYGLYLCRGDVNKADCEACVQTASKDILKQCPNDKTAIVWYDNCLLRYSNQTDFPDTEWFMWNTQNSTDPESFNDYVGNTMNDLATQASSDVSGKKFAVKESNFSAFEKLFSLVQCIPDMSSTNCDICLRGIIQELPTCCNGKQGGRVLVPNCNIRYENYAFYSVAPPPPPPPAPAPVLNLPITPASNVTLPPPPPNSNSPDKGGKKRMSVLVRISIIVLIVVAVILVVVAFVFMRKRSKKRLSSTDGKLLIPTVESLNYSLVQVQYATNNFSEDCKIGQGGFGPVYKVCTIR